MPLKAELHCHIEGAASPELVIEQARKYGKDVSPYIRDGSFVWHDFTSFLAAYDFASDLFRSEEDYARLSEHYLTSLARDGAIYSEVLHLAGPCPQGRSVAAGLYRRVGRRDPARQGEDRHRGPDDRHRVRHVGVEAIEQAARFAAKCGHPLVTGFGVAGDERMGEFEDYVRAFEIAREAGLGITIHAGELMGWESVEAAMNHIKPSRIGHGVRAIENPDLVKRIADEGIVLECCPGSNVALASSRVFPSIRFLS